MSAADNGPDDDDYKSSEDQDFDPTAASKDEEDNVSSSSDNESEPGASASASAGARRSRPSGKRRKQVAFDDELGSGDEETIRQSKKARKQRRGADGDGADDQDVGGAGGEIKTRAQRRAEKQERAEFRKSKAGEVTVDVDDLWARLSSAPIGRRALVVPEPVADRPVTDNEPSLQKETAEEHLVTITRVHEFAGETIHSQVRVHKDSDEARDFATKQQQKTKAADSQVQTSALRRPLARASAYEPNPRGEVKGLPAHRQRLRPPSRADVLARQTQQQAQTEEEERLKAQRLNTVQKSALDWAQHLDAQQGMRDELGQYGRSKAGFMDKMDFLQGVSSRREMEEKRARLQAA